MDKIKNIEPGTLVYCIEGDDFSGYLFVARCLNYTIVCPDYMDCSDFCMQLEEMSNRSYELGNPDLYIFPTSKVFLTISEALAYMHQTES